MENITIIEEYLIEKGVNKDIVTILVKKQILQKMLKNVNVSELAHDMQEGNIYDIDKILEIYENEGFAIFSKDDYSKSKDYLVEYGSDLGDNIKIKTENIIGYVPGSPQDLTVDQTIYMVEEQILDMLGNVKQSTERKNYGYDEIKKRKTIPSIIDVVKNTMEDISQNEVLNNYLKDNGFDKNLLNLPFFREYFSHVEQFMIDNHGFERFDDGTKKQYRPIYSYDPITGTLKSKGRANSEIRIEIIDNEEYILEEISPKMIQKHVKDMSDYFTVGDGENENGTTRTTQSKLVYHVSKDGIGQSRDVYSGISYIENADPKLEFVERQELRSIKPTKSISDVPKKTISLRTIREAVKKFNDRERE